MSDFAEETDIDKKLKMLYDESADRTEFEQYKERLGSDAPKSFSDFQKIKYGDVNKGQKGTYLFCQLLIWEEILDE